MDRTEIENKLNEIEKIMNDYRLRLKELERQLFNVIKEFRQIVDKERIEELRKEIYKKDG